jgi:hypothetical protein
MKTKKFGKKLVLNKKTVAHLDIGKLRAAKGGYIPLNTIETCSCETCGDLETCGGKSCLTFCITCVTGNPCIACVFEP